MVRILSKNGADIKAKDNFDKTALQMAAFLGIDTMVQLSIRIGIDVNAIAKHRYTALHLTSKNGYQWNGASIAIMIRMLKREQKKDARRCI